MELKEAIGKLQELTPTLIYLEDKQALQTVIPHLETLQKVKDMGGVKKKLNPAEQIRVRFDYETDEKILAYNKGWNDVIDLKDSELAGKLEGLENVFAKIKGCKPNQEDCSFGKCHDFSGCKILQEAIQELILEKKEE